jgi:hypothetical protein
MVQTARSSWKRTSCMFAAVLPFASMWHIALGLCHLLGDEGLPAHLLLRSARFQRTAKAAAPFAISARRDKTV